MFNFTYYNPVKIVFGKGTITGLDKLVPDGVKIMLAYGSGSIKKNGVYDQVIEALKGKEVIEFAGIEPNPEFETLMKAVELARAEKIGFILAVGGGSVVDGVKFIAAAIPLEKGREWDIMSNPSVIKSAIPFGSVLTLPATGSEMNPTAVISRAEKGEKLPFSHPLVYPIFSILDPLTTFSLPEKQSANGVVDTFIHVTEQYLTFPNNTPLQDRQAEAILLTLIEEGHKVMESPWDYDARANIMWCATQALNGLIGCGTPQDWATHMIGHELTALYGIDHARTLAVVLPALLRYRKKEKAEKLLQFASRIWGINSGKEDDRIEAAIVKTEEFFKSLGIPVKLSEYGVDKKLLKGVGERIESRRKLGESGDIGAKEVSEIIELAW